MGDLLRIVDLAWPADPVEVLDVNTAGSIYMERGTLRVAPGARRDRYAQSDVRYGGSIQTGQAHDNATIAATFRVRGDTPAQVAARVEQLLAEADHPVLGRRALEWRPDGLTESAYSRIRGTATWTPTYQWVLWLGARQMLVEISWPVAPLAELKPIVYSYGVAQTPRKLTVANVPGTAPALADVALIPSNPATAVDWALLAWQKTGTGGAWFGVHDSAAAGGPYASLTEVATTAIGNSVLRMNTSTHKIAAAIFNLGTARGAVAPFAVGGEIDVEVDLWGATDPTVVGGRVTVSVAPDFAQFTVREYTREFGAAGRPIAAVTGARRRRLWRLGTLTLRDSDFDGNTQLKVALAAADASTGNIDIDAVGIVPIHARAAAPTGKVRDAAYPTVIPALPGSEETVKTIRSDLSGVLEMTAPLAGAAEHSGLGGQPIMLEPGSNELAVWTQSGAVPDDPVNTADAATNGSVAVRVTVTPRVRLMASG